MTKTDWKFGILLFIGFVAYFLFMKSTDLYTELNLRAFNLTFHALFIYLAIRSFYNSQRDTNSINYVEGVLAGVRPGLIGVLLFCAFQIIYLHSDDTLMMALKENGMVGSYLNPYTASAVLLFEGLGVTMVLSYIFMRVVDAQNRDKYTIRDRKEKIQ